MQKLKITEKGWEGYTGFFGQVEFKDGVSVSPVDPYHLNHLSGLVRCVLVDADGKELGQAGVAAAIAGGVTTVAAAVEKPLARATEAAVAAEQKKLAVQAEKPPHPLLTVADLEKIGAEGGIRAVRVVADKWGVRDRSIPGLIKEIMKAQAQWQSRIDAVAAEERALQAKAAEEAARSESPADAPASDVDAVEVGGEIPATEVSVATLESGAKAVTVKAGDVAATVALTK